MMLMQYCFLIFYFKSICCWYVDTHDSDKYPQQMFLKKKQVEAI